MKDAVIIGLGPAGITAALYLLRAKADILCFEKMVFGGQINLTDKIENYPGFPNGISGFELAQLFKKQLDEFSPQIISEKVLGVEKDKEGILTVKVSSSEFKTRSIIIATGAYPKRLNIKGEEVFTGRGVSYCAICDAMFFKDKIIAVIGGGNSAIEEAIYLSKFVKKIYLIHRRDRLRADKIFQERLKVLNNVEFVFSSTVEEIRGEKKVESILVNNLNAQTAKEIILDGVFIFAGYTPNTEFLKDFLQLDKGGYIITKENLITNVEGVFACGDVRSGSLKQVVSSCGEGAQTAVGCMKYVEKLKGTSYD
ncbi:MAG: thioredoxin-disulfide reductase [Candidatus Saelkia tenebricola]|nr:thioredoxin-disulfide reductase [Candidatus Saelkia tenebricola]